MGHRNAGILVVDDQEDIRDLLKDHLEDQGYGCHTASSCDGAMQVLATESVDLAMLDIIMPGTTGLKLFQEIREAHPDIAVIFVTAMSDVNFAVGNIKNGAYDYLVKPVSRKHLLEAVEQTLSKREDLLKKRQNQLWLQESVKKSISEYLHGHVQSKLLVLQHKIRQCQQLVAQDREKASALLGEIGADLRSVQEQDIREVSRELYPSIVKVGLAPSLRSLVDRFRDRVSVELYVGPEIESVEGHNWNLFPEEFRVGVYRIVEEALDNVVKHAQAKTAKVFLFYLVHGRVYLEIIDDGRGFEPSNVDSFFGLMTMREYAESLGGTCRIETAPRQGTKICIALPVLRGPQLTATAQEGQDYANMSQYCNQHG